MLLLWHTINYNFGDVLIYKTISDFLTKKGIQSDYLDVGVSCETVMNIAKDYDFFLFAGGGIIERYVPNVIRYFKDDYTFCNKPYGIIGISIGGFDYSQYKKTLTYWIKHASFFFTRDVYSANYLNGLCNTNKAEVSVDVVWASSLIIGGAYNQMKKSINIRNMPYIDITGDLDWELLKKNAILAGYDNYILDESGQEKKICFTENEKMYSVETVLKQIFESKSIIAMRYHVVLVAIANKIPILPIAYCPKVKRLAEYAGIKDYMLEVNQVGDVANICNKMEENEKNIITHMDKIYRQANSKARNTINQIIGVIEEEVRRIN